jgi:hypothetical protein
MADIFDISRWEVKDRLTECVRKFDLTIKSMYERGGRHDRRRGSILGMNRWEQGYGQQLAWNGLFMVAGDLLARYPVVNPIYGEASDAWQEWLDRELLTRKDGIWLADGVDRPPIETQVNLLEKGGKGLILTSNQAKMLSLLGINKSAGHASFVVAGDWKSFDDVRVRITSALVPPRKARELARQLANKDAFQAWVPFAEEHEDRAEASPNRKHSFVPWIVMPSSERGLDDTDSLAAQSVMQRPRFTKKVNALGPLQPVDDFQRAWVDGNGSIAARAEAWGKNRMNEDELRDGGYRLSCGTEYLKTVLKDMRMDLLILVVLRRYEKGYGDRESQYWHTTAVLRVKQSTEFEWYPGEQNRLHESKW